MRRLLTHLAQFSAFSKQGELLCTHGLAYLLENPAARAEFGAYIAKQTGRTVGSNLTWYAEARQPDGGRPDLEARTDDGKTLAKIEAKLGAAFGEGQLSSFAADLQTCCDSGLLLVLVPRHRAEEIATSVLSTFSLTGDGPWRLGDTSDCMIAVIYWEEVLGALGTVCSEPFSGDLAQFQAMYRVLKGYDFEPLANDAELRSWRERNEGFVNLVDRVTRHLTQQSQLLPMGHERAPHDYKRRYVCRQLGNEQPCFSLGVRAPFKGHKTPIWLRFNRTTPKFSVIHDRLFASSLSQRLVESGGHIWIPLEVTLGADGERLVGSLVAQAEDVIQVAYQPLP